MLFSSIRDLLAEQWSRLSSLEQALFFWLAVVREAATSEQLHALVVPPVDSRQVGEALEALQRRSLVEWAKVEAADREPERYTLHSVVLEYVTEVLVERVSEQVLPFVSPEPKASRASGVGAMAFEEQHAEWEHLLSYALEQATAKDYVRQAQERLIVEPVLVRLQAMHMQAGALEQQLVRLLGDTIFTDAFGGITAAVISHSGAYWATASKRGEVRVWRVGREAGHTLHLVWQAHTDQTYGLAFSPDEGTLASGSWDGSLRELQTLVGHTDKVKCVTWSPDGRILASGSFDHTIRLWDSKAGSSRAVLQGLAPL